MGESSPISFYRYLALEGLCLMSNSEFSADAVRKHQETVVSALKANLSSPNTLFDFLFLSTLKTFDIVIFLLL